MRLYGEIYEGDKALNKRAGYNLLRVYSTLKHYNASEYVYTDCDINYDSEVTIRSYFVHLDPVDKTVLPYLCDKANLSLSEVEAEFDAAISIGNKILVTEEWD